MLRHALAPHRPGERNAWHGLAFIAGALSVCVASASAAQAQGNGVLVGEGRLHAQIGAETHEIFNPGYQLRGQETSDIMLVVKPKATYELGSDQLTLKSNAVVEYRRYLGYVTKDTTGLSTFAGTFDLALGLNQLGDVPVTLAEQVVRAADAGNQSITTPLRHTSSTTGISLQVKPGGGALLFDASYGLFYDRYDRSGNPAYLPSQVYGTPPVPGEAPVPIATNLDTLRQTPSVKSTWKFLPRTGLFLEARGVLASYPGNGGANQSMSILLAEAGAVGSVTGKLSVLLKAGYGDTFLSSTDNFRSVIGQAELTYELTSAAKLRVGFLRTVQPVTLFKYFALMRPYAEFEAMLFGTTAVQVKARYDIMDFGAPRLSTIPQTSRHDANLGATLAVEHRFRDWLSVSLSDTLTLHSSQYKANNDAGADYTVNDVMLSAALLY